MKAIKAELAEVERFSRKPNFYCDNNLFSSKKELNLTGYALISV